MTWWASNTVYLMAKGVRLEENDARKATAVALIASGGADHYRYSVEGVEGSERMGLMALTGSEAAAGAPGHRMDPTASLAMAGRVTKANSGSWAWHPVVNADHGVLLRAVLVELDASNAWNTPAVHSHALSGDPGRYSYLRDLIRAPLGTLPSW